MKQALMEQGLRCDEQAAKKKNSLVMKIISTFEEFTFRRQCLILSNLFNLALWS